MWLRNSSSGLTRTAISCSPSSATTAFLGTITTPSMRLRRSRGFETSSQDRLPKKVSMNTLLFSAYPRPASTEESIFSTSSDRENGTWQRSRLAAADQNDEDQSVVMVQPAARKQSFFRIWSPNAYPSTQRGLQNLAATCLPWVIRVVLTVGRSLPVFRQ